MNNLIQISLFGLIVIIIIIGVLIIYFLWFWLLRELRNKKEFYKTIIDDSEVKLNNNELPQKHETLLSLINYGNHIFKKGSGIRYKIKDLKVIVYFDFLIDEETELPTVIIGTKFLDGENEILFDFIIDKYGDGCIKSDKSNKRRKNKIMLAISFAEYFLTEECIYSDKDLKVTKTIRTALPISGLDNIEGYSLELI